MRIECLHRDQVFIHSTECLLGTLKFEPLDLVSRSLQLLPVLRQDGSFAQKYSLPSGFDSRGIP